MSKPVYCTRVSDAIEAESLTKYLLFSVLFFFNFKYPNVATSFPSWWLLPHERVPTRDPRRPNQELHVGQPTHNRLLLFLLASFRSRRFSSLCTITHFTHLKIPLSSCSTCLFIIRSWRGRNQKEKLEVLETVMRPFAGFFFAFSNAS
jgi:hypothetical protein